MQLVTRLVASEFPVRPFPRSRLFPTRAGRSAAPSCAAWTAISDSSWTSPPDRVGLRAVPTSRRHETDLEALLAQTQTQFFMCAYHRQQGTTLTLWSAVASDGYIYKSVQCHCASRSNLQNYARVPECQKLKMWVRPRRHSVTFDISAL